MWRFTVYCYLSAILSIRLSVSKILFFPVLIRTIYIRSSASSILFIWAALELNIISVLPLLRLENSVFRTEVRIKYFLVQALGSSVLLLGAFLRQTSRPALSLVELALVLKLGAGPLHLWLVRVMRLCTLEILFLLSTFQKVIPLITMQALGTRIISFRVAAISSIVAGWGVFNHRRLRAILAYSSVFTVAWCIRRTGIIVWNWLVYLGVYTLSLVIFILHVRAIALTTISHLQLASTRFSVRLSLFLILGTIGGLPPLSGFWIKVVILSSLFERGDFFLGIILLGRSIWILYIYIRVRFLRVRLRQTSRVWGQRRRDRLFRVLVLGSLLPVFILISLFYTRGCKHIKFWFLRFQGNLSRVH